MSDKLSVDDRHKAPRLLTDVHVSTRSTEHQQQNLPEEVGNEINPITMKAQNDDDCKDSYCTAASS